MEEKKDNNLAVVCHLLGVVGFLGPLIMWLIQKDSSSVVNEHAKEALNFQISILIYSMVAAVSTVILIGAFLFPAVIIFNYVMIVIAAVKVSSNQPFKYPLTLRLIK